MSRPTYNQETKTVKRGAETSSRGTMPVLASAKEPVRAFLKKLDLSKIKAW